MNVTVIGTGYVGLTTGVMLAALGHKVICLDVDERKLEQLRRGMPTIYEPHLEDLLKSTLPNLVFTSDYATSIPEAEVVFITVGTPSLPDGNPDLRFLRAAAQSIGQNLSTKGSQSRSFQFVTDLIEGIRRLMTVEHFDPVNLGNPEEYTMLELAQLIQELVGSTLPLEYKALPQDDPKQRRSDNSKAKALLDWQPVVPVRLGLEQTIRYFREIRS